MSRQKKNYVGKIGYCDNATLGIKGADGKPIRGGHYVYIRDMRGNKCDVNIITSLEDRKQNLYDYKIQKVRKGFLYPVPKNDANFNQWSAINLDGNINGIKFSDIKDIGKKKMKQRHKWFVGKFHK